MLKYPCLVLDHDDTVVQSEATVNYPCFCEFLKIHRPGTVFTLAEYFSECSKMPFVELCRSRFHFTEAELQEEYLFWKDYADRHIPLPFPGISELLHGYRNAGGRICVVSMSSEKTIRRDYQLHFGFQPDLIFSCDLPQEQRKPNPYALEQTARTYGFQPRQMLVVDDMTFAIPMARAVGCPMAFAAWGRQDFPELRAEMEQRCDFTFRSPKDLMNFLFD